MNDPTPANAVDGGRDLTGFISAVFAAWHRAGVSFLVLRNYENLPRSVSNGVDILVNPQQLSLAESVLLKAAPCAGYQPHNRAEFSPVSLFFFHRESLQQIQVDLFAKLQWRGFTLFSVEEILARRTARDSFSIPHPAHEAAINLVTRLIYKGYVQDKYRPGIAAAFRAHSGTAERLLADTFGRRLARLLVHLAAAERWADIERKVTALRVQLVVRQLVWHPCKTLQAITTDMVRLTRRFLSSPGITVAFIGPDGCGKTTVVSRVVEKLRPTFNPANGLQTHWKPDIFMRKRRQRRGIVTNPHGEAPRPCYLSLLFLAWHCFEFLVGALVQKYPVRFRNGMVTIDRFYYDFFADQRRYRLNVPQLAIRVGCALLPKPDLVFLLDAPPEALRGRKQEVPAEETVRQCAAYRKVVARLPNGVVIDATQPVEKEAVDIQKAVLEYLARRIARRLKSEPAAVQAPALKRADDA
jgi:thymidylate kinase